MSTPEEIRRLSDELARDPSSLAFLSLGETLRRQGQLDVALKVALRGLERHPHHADAHDLLARVAVDRGELQRAFDEWDMVLRLAPGHLGALKGMGFVCFQQGKREESERYLNEAAERGGGSQIEGALAAVRRAGPLARLEGFTPSNGNGAVHGAFDGDGRASTTQRGGAAPGEVPQGATMRAIDPHMLFADLLGDLEQTALLLDAQGLVLAGAYVDEHGSDVAQEVGAELSGMSDEAQRATRHLELGDWRAIVVETEVAVVAMAPAEGDGLVLVAAARSVPLGLVRRVLDRCAARARQWVEARR